MSGDKQKFKKKIKRFGNTLKTYRHICFYCGTKIDEYSRTVDHIVPKSQGGILSNDNKVNCCQKCNRLKADNDPFDFMDLLDTMIRFEQMKSRETVGYLKKVKQKTKRMIDSRKIKNADKKTNIENTKEG